MPGSQSKIDLTPLTHRTDYAPETYWRRVEQLVPHIGRVVIEVSNRPSVAPFVHRARPFNGEIRKRESVASAANLTAFNGAQMRAGLPAHLMAESRYDAYVDARQAYLASGALNSSSQLPEYYLHLIPAFIGKNRQSKASPEKIVDLLGCHTPSLSNLVSDFESIKERDRRQLTYLDRITGLAQEAGIGFSDQPPSARDRRIGRYLLEISGHLANRLCSYELVTNGCVSREIRRRDFDLKFFELYMEAKEGRLNNDPTGQRRQFARLQKLFGERFLEWGEERERTWSVYDHGIAAEWLQALGYRHHIYSRGLIAKEYLMFGTPRIERPDDGLSGKGVAKKHSSDLVVVVNGQRYYIQSKVSGHSQAYAAPIIVTSINPQLLGEAKSCDLSDKSEDSAKTQKSKRSGSYLKQRFVEIAGEYVSYYTEELKVMDPNDKARENLIRPYPIERILAQEVLKAA